MAEQDLTVAHRDDVVMKNPRVDRRRMLAGEDQLAGIDLIEARYRLAGLKGLPRRIATRRLLAPPAAAIDKELDAGSAILAAETIMVRRPFVAKPGRGGQRRVDSKSRAVGENRLQQRLCSRCFAGAVEFILQIRHRQMHQAIQRIGGGTHRRRVRHPHRRGRTHRRQQIRLLLRHPGHHLLIAAAKAQLAQKRHVGTLLRRDHRLRVASVGEGFHFFQPLLGRQLRVRHPIAMPGGSLIAKGEPGVVMGQPGQTVKVDFAGGHDASPARKSSPGLRLAGSVRVGDSRLAIGQAQ